MKKVEIQLETLSCPSCLQKINNAVKRLVGVDKESVNIMFNASKVKLNFDSSKLNVKEIETAIDKLGYQVLKSKVSTL